MIVYVTFKSQVGFSNMCYMMVSLNLKYDFKGGVSLSSELISESV